MNPRWDRMLQTSPGKIAVFGVFWGSPKWGGGLWFIPMNSPTMEAKMMLRSAQQPTWRRLLIGIRWVSRIPVFFFATQLGESQMMGQKTDKKRKSNDHIWDIYGIYMDIYQLFNYTKPWRRALSSQLWHAVLMWQRLGSMSRNEGGLTHQMGPESRPALPRLVELGW